MKVNIELDMTPEEVRARATRACDAGDPEAMMRAWMPFFPGSGEPEAFQKFRQFLWDGAGRAAGRKTAE